MKLNHDNRGLTFATKKGQWALFLHTTGAKPDDARRSSVDIYRTKKAALEAFNLLPNIGVWPIATGAAYVAGARDKAEFNLEHLPDAMMEEILEDYQETLADVLGSDDDGEEPDLLVGKTFSNVEVPTVDESGEYKVVKANVYICPCTRPLCVTVRFNEDGVAKDIIMTRTKVLQMCKVGGDPTDAFVACDTYKAASPVVLNTPRARGRTDECASAKDVHELCIKMDIDIPMRDGATTTDGWRVLAGTCLCTLNALIASKKSSMRCETLPTRRRVRPSAIWL